MFATDSKRHVFAAIVAYLFLGGWVTAQEQAPPAEKQPASKDAEKLQVLLKERRDEAEKLVQIRMARVKGNLVVPDVNLIEAFRVLLLAELELADKPKDRIELHEKYLENAKEVEDFAKRTVERSDPAAYPQMRAYRCEAELGLLCQRAGDKRSAKQAEEIKKLLIDRRDAIREAVKFIEARIQGGLWVPDSNYHELSRQLARVEVELAEDAKQRGAAREEYVKRTKESEKITEVQAKAGRAYPTIAPLAHASRCDAEIGLRSERAGDKPSAAQAAEIKKLLEEHRDALSEAVKSGNARVTQGLAVVDLTLLDTIQRLLQVELELAEQLEQRVAMMETHLNMIRECEKSVETGAVAGKVSPEYHLQAKVARLNVEIGLLRERMKVKPPEKCDWGPATRGARRLRFRHM